MIDPLKLVRPNILALSPYSTARDEYKGGNFNALLDANESPYETGLNRYPDPRQAALKKRLSELKGIPSGRIFIGNGSDEAIDLCYRIFCRPGVDNAILMAPSYGMYKVCADTNDIATKQIMLREDFSLDTQALLALQDDKTKLLFLCSPNNPTGTVIPFPHLEDILEGFGGMVVLDEAYVDFSAEGSALGLLDKYSNLIILQTMSKAWGMAGLRVGLAFSREEVISIFDKVKYPYNVNILSQRTALGALDRRTLDAHVEEVLSQREMLRRELPSCPGVVKVYDSEANFLLVQFRDPKGVYDKLISKGIIVRDRSSVPLCGGCLRITVGTPAQNDSLLRILRGEEPAHSRHVTLSRRTAETFVTVDLDLDSPPVDCKISTGLGFFDHMLMQIPHHGGVRLNISVQGDLQVDEHHTMEDTGIVLGKAIAEALGDKVGISRYGFSLPMDESEAMVLLDFGGRADLEWDVHFTRDMVGDTPTEMFKHFFYSLCSGANCNIHVNADGENNHHLAESIFKAFARALGMAVARTSSTSAPSSKGVL